jgi:hypothetical protein
MSEERRTRRLGGQFETGRPCAHPGCEAAGEFRAPLHKPGSSFAPPAGPPQWQYLCLDHVREFNAQWNFFAGMDEAEIWAAQSPYPAWEREVRAFATNADPRRPAAPLDDPLGILRWKTADRSTPRLPPEDERALKALNLGPDATLADVKSRYRELARRYHPDANAGDRRHEARLQAVSDAHAHLVKAMTRRPPAGRA